MTDPQYSYDRANEAARNVAEHEAQTLTDADRLALDDLRSRTVFGQMHLDLLAEARREGS